MVSIERFRPEHLAAVVRLARQTFDAPYPVQFFLQAAEADPGMLVAVDEATGRVVGFVLAARSGPMEARVALIGVAPEAQSRGVGRRLMRRLQATLQRRDVRRLALEVRTDNPGALDFYLRQGFTVEGVQEGVYPDGADAYVLAKPLR